MGPKGPVDQYIKKLQKMDKKQLIGLAIKLLSTPDKDEVQVVQSEPEITPVMETLAQQLGGSISNVEVARALLQQMSEEDMREFGDVPVPDNSSTIYRVGDPKTHPPGECVFTGGTFSGNPLNSAAGYAALDVIDRAEGRLNKHANRLGERFRDGLNEVFERYSFPTQAVGCCSTNGVAFTERLPVKSVLDYKANADKEKLYKWHMYLATYHGIYTYPGFGAIFIAAVHTKEDIDHLIATTEEFVRRERS